MIPLSVPLISGNEWTYVKDCLDTGWISSAGSYVTKFENMIAGYVGASYGVACMNGTTGLHLALVLSDIQPGDHVIAPNITFVATLNSISYTGADPILIDVEHDSWQMNLLILEDWLLHNTEKKPHNGSFQTINKHTGKPIKAIMPVHVLGVMGDMNHLMQIATLYNLKIIEDSTEALGSTYKGQQAGTFGEFGVFSFNGNKIISTGGGGVIVTNDEKLAQKAKHLSTQAKVSAVEYIHDSIGYNYRLVNLLAAVGVAQMENFSMILNRKKFIDQYYRTHLNGVGDIEFQQIPPFSDPNCWLFTFKTKKMKELLEYLNFNQVQARPFWMPMNQLPMFSNQLYISANDHSKSVYETCISVPSSASIDESQLDKVVQTIKKFYA